MVPLLFARSQFAANITFHILFLLITIALGWLLMFFRWRWLRTQDAAWLAAYRFCIKVLALSFALGVVSSITISFQFGTNWPVYMETVGNVASPLLPSEVLMVFFLEAGYLGVMLFGHGLVNDCIHMMASFFVAFGTTVNAFWILARNSWMHNSAGHDVIDGLFQVKTWADMVFNPSFSHRLAYALLASVLSCAFVFRGLPASHLVRGKIQDLAPKVLRIGLTVAALVILLQIFVGNLHGLNTLEHQPQKAAATVGAWVAERGAPLLLFAWADAATRSNHFEIGIPNLAHFILTYDFDGEIKGLNDFPTARPPVAPVFWAFRIMVSMGVLMLAVSWAAWWLGRRAAWSPTDLPRPVLWVLAGMTFSGWTATVAGWYLTEIGRQHSSCTA